MAELGDLRVLLLEAYDQLERDVEPRVDIALKRQAKHANLEAKVGVQGWRWRLSPGDSTMDKALHDAQEDLAEAQERLRSTRLACTASGGDARPQGARMQVSAADRQVEDAGKLSPSARS